MQEHITLVTGGTAGIGRETARGIARQGGTVVIVGRSSERCEQAALELRQSTGNEKVEWIAANLAARAGVDTLVQSFLERYPHLDVLVNNAGGVFGQRKLTAEGLERTLALNHLSYFRLTLALGGALERGSAKRVVVVSSDAHRYASLKWDDLGFEKGFNRYLAYGQSKLMNVLFARELARHWRGMGIAVNALHPGAVATDIWKAGKVLERLIHTVMLTPEEGARTSVFLATSSEVEGVTGGYFNKSRQVQPSARALDDAAAARLWSWSEAQG